MVIKIKPISTNTSTNKVESNQAVKGNIVFGDGTNQLIRITDEDTSGAIQIPDGLSLLTTNKLYSVGVSLFFN